MGSLNAADIDLVPWDPASDAHFERMLAQREGCGWDADLVPYWRTKVSNGQKLLFWVVLSGDGAMALLAKHNAAPDGERAPLNDSAVKVGKSAREPTGDEFVPIGHIALDEYPARNTLFGLPEATLWIKSLYISRVIQKGGLGYKAMKRVEAMAAAAPFHSEALALDTPERSVHVRVTSRMLYGTDEPPAGSPPIRANHDWYLGQGYSMMDLPEREAEVARGENRSSLGIYPYPDPVTGEELHIPCVFLYKKIE